MFKKLMILPVLACALFLGIQDTEAKKGQRSFTHTETFDATYNCAEGYRSAFSDLWDIARDAGCSGLDHCTYGWDEEIERCLLSCTATCA